MTADEKIAIGELTGTLKSLAAQFAVEHEETRDALKEVHDELAKMREHRLEVAAVIARQLAAFKSEDFVPLKTTVDALVHWRVYLSGALGTATLAIALNALKVWGII